MSNVVEEIDGHLGIPIEVEKKLVNMALSTLGNRALVWAAGMGGAAIWGYATMHPEPIRLWAALGYCFSVLGPILWRDVRRG